ncbi:MAG: hypothetical protein A2231_02525 [Candidatus Firestonebacteria bacterium RIFOXYA2_FULL_40_8]|nr:MAG: hypothetical protein A2231_02525 [Candidatus Firestonebacteria bacterium RIFOXYA2_FULL_40_8]
MKNSILKCSILPLLFQFLFITPFNAEANPPVDTVEHESSAKSAVRPEDNAAAEFFAQPEYKSRDYVQPVEFKNEGLYWALRRLRLEVNSINFVIDLKFEEKMEENTIAYAGVKNITVNFKERTELHEALKQVLEPLGLAFYIDNVTGAEKVYHINYKNNPDKLKRIFVKYPFQNNIYADIKKLNSKDGIMNLLYSELSVQVNDYPEVHKKIRELYRNIRESGQKVAEKERGKIVAKIYPITYVNAGELTRQIMSVLTKDGTIEFNTKGNYLTITDIAENHIAIGTLLKELDSTR